ncbi:ABC transporter permease [Haematospirillum sp. H1815]|uniref:ABC transporter permease n=1 Tax=Haematospirillum sp. H1815 TaxID=2723108 RepID=UPI001439BBC0|nr:ABC transporter permease [Haematospirillum sp. H1815]NKD77574.1 ABC transporter permease [Haematospirillum sp. H1815]
MSTTHQTPWQKRRDAFRAQRRSLWSLRILGILFLLSLCAEFLANDRPLLIVYDGKLYVPVIADYPETTFGGFFPTYTDYHDPEVGALIDAKGFALWPPLRFSYNTIDTRTHEPPPVPPNGLHPLGTDGQGQDILAQILYGFRSSMLFSLTLTTLSVGIAIMIGALQGFYGGHIDLFGQRALEIWSGLPQLFILIILASLIAPSFWSILLALALFSWTSLVGLVRAEVLKVRAQDYVRAARALGAGNTRILWRHILPNALTASLTMAPFLLAGSIVTLAALDLIGYGLPSTSASLGALLKQGKESLDAPWVGISGFITLAGCLTMLVFVGEGVRDALDPRRNPGRGEA